MVLMLRWAQKRMFWVFEKNIFQVFANFWLMKLKQFSGKARQRLQDHLNSKFVIGMFFENGFEATLGLKTNVLSTCKEKFLDFCKFCRRSWNHFSGNWNFKSKFGYRMLLIKWFWSFLEVKNHYCGRSKLAFYSFLQFFDWRSWNHFPEKIGKVFKTI